MLSPNKLTDSEQEADEALKAAFPLPAFHNAKTLKMLAIMTAADGSSWGFVRYPYNWLHAPLSARAEMNGQTMEVGLRMRWNDEPSPIPKGDCRFVDQIQLEKEPQLAPLLEQLPREPHSWIGTIELPSHPSSITIVDE